MRAIVYFRIGFWLGVGFDFWGGCDDLSGDCVGFAPLSLLLVLVLECLSQSLFSLSGNMSTMEIAVIRPLPY